MSSEVIILSDSDSDDAAPAKKARTATATQDDVAEYQPAAAPLVAGPEDEGGSDEDIVFVGAVGEDALKDFPHPRHACRNFPFEDSRLHKLACAKCHCYVCDVLADECASWGDGSDPKHHCHASNADPAWVLARRTRQVAATAAAAPPAPAPHVPFSFGVSAAPPLPLPSTALPPGHVRVRPTAPELLPDPATLPGLLLLGQLRLPVRQAEKSSTSLAHVAGRLLPHGLCELKRHEVSTGVPNNGLVLRQLVEYSSFYSGSEAQVYIELLPLTGRTPAPTTRSVRLLACHHDGRAPPKEYSLTMDKDATREDLAQRAAQLLGLDPATEQVVIMHTSTAPRTAASPARTRLVSFVVGAHTNGMGVLVCGDTPELRAKKLPTGSRLQNTFPTFVAYRLPKGLFLGVFLRTMGTRTQTFKRRAEVRRYGVAMEVSIHTPQGGLVLLPAPASGAMGGKRSAVELQESLAAFLDCIAKAGVDHVPPTQLLHSGPGGDVEYNDIDHTSASQQIPFSIAKDVPLSAGYSYAAALKADPSLATSVLRYVGADWDPDTLDASYSVDLLTRPTDLDASATADRAAELESLHAEFAEQSSKARPGAVLQELVRASTVSWESQHQYHPNSHQVMSTSHYRSTPLVRLTAVLEVDAAKPKEGTLKLDIYVLEAAQTPLSYLTSYSTGSTPPVQHCLPIFNASAEHQGSSSSNLKETIVTLLERDSPNHVRNTRAWRELDYSHGNDPSITSIPGLLRVLESTDSAEAPQPPGLAVDLRSYQKQALKFMLDAENMTDAGHFWSALPLPAGAAGSAASTAPSTVYWSPLLTRLTREEPTRCKGGMLCSEMGLGKTVVSLACVLAAPETRAVTAAKAKAHAAAVAAAPSSSAAKRIRIPSRATLVVCAVSLVGQWVAEVQQKLADKSISIHMYHGQGREKSAARLAKFDIVVTTYQTMGMDFGKADCNEFFEPLGLIDWHRVILDEAHAIKNPKMQQSLACMALSADRRWAVTGTPIGTEVTDLFGQLCFLRISPFNTSAFFDSHVKRVFTATGNVYGGSPVALLYALSRIMIRHTKQQKLGGVAVLTLPAKHETRIAVEFSPEERKAYDKAHAEAARQFKTFVAQGQHVVAQRMLQIMSLLLPLRRMASGGALTDKEILVPDVVAAAAARAAAIAAKTAAMQATALAAAMAAAGYGPTGVKPESKPRTAGGAGPSTAAAVDSDDDPMETDKTAALEAAHAIDAKPVLAMENDADAECGLCGEVPETPVRTGCQHWFCAECLLGALPDRASAAKCPTCKKPVDARAVRKLSGGGGAEEEEEEEAEAAPAPAPAPKPVKPKPKPKAKPKKRAASSEEEDFDSDDDSDMEGAPVAHGPSIAASRPRRGAAAATAGQAAPAPADEEAEEDKDDPDASEPEAEAGAGPSVKKAKPAGAKSKKTSEPVALRSESKLKLLIKKLLEIRKEDESAKCLIFSQFNSTLDWLKDSLRAEGFGYRFIDGSMPLKQRAKAIEAFQKDPPTTVFVLSMRSGAVGINLTSASRIFLMEPVLNPALEAQAIGRAWRMGQLNEVHVYHLYVKDSVEQRIIELTAQKATAGANAGPTAGSKALADLRIAKGKAKLLVSEIAGAIKSDRQALRLNELELLFSVRRFCAHASLLC